MSTTHSDHQALTAAESFGPVRPSERMVLLDVLRGFAILGIIFVNNDPANLFRKVLFPSAPDRFGHTLVYILGVGFAFQLERAAARGVNIIPTYLRRLFFLALLGCVLSLLIHVPQLLNLAIAGVPMLFIGYVLRRRPSSALLAVALALQAASCRV